MGDPGLSPALVSFHTPLSPGPLGADGGAVAHVLVFCLFVSPEAEVTRGNGLTPECAPDWPGRLVKHRWPGPPRV